MKSFGSGDPLPLVGTGVEQSPLTLKTARHLLRRTGFGCTERQINSFIGLSPAQAVSTLIQEAVDHPIPERPDWIDLYDHPDRFQHFLEMSYDWLRQMYNLGLREKMALFWHTHFATAFGTHGRTTMTYRSLELYRSQAFGDFFGLLRDVGINPDMLWYLDGWKNKVGSPNENFAREVCELFTMGPTDLDGNVNYTENDIVEISKACTGWEIDRINIVGAFFSENHDDSEKIIFGDSDHHDYHDVISLIKERRGPQTAEFLCTKLYKFFVYETVNVDVVRWMAQVMVDSNYDIRTTLEALLSSQHFFQQDAIGAKLKSPLEAILGMAKEAEFHFDDYPDDGFYVYAFQAARDLQQEVLQQPDVAGWQGGPAWFSTSLLPKRWGFAKKFLNGNYQRLEAQDLRSWAKDISSGSNLPYVVLGELVGRWFSVTPDNSTIQLLYEAFMEGIPEDEIPYWTLSHMEAQDQLRNLALAVYTLPEYQLT